MCSHRSVLQSGFLQESPADWAPYENYIEEKLYLPNGTALPATEHRKELHDWQYVLRLKAGR